MNTEVNQSPAPAVTGDRLGSSALLGWISEDVNETKHPKCYNCDGDGFVEYPEFEINACERCGGSGILPNAMMSHGADGSRTKL